MSASHFVECAEGRQDRSSNRYRVLSLWRSNHHDLHRGCSHAVNSFVMHQSLRTWSCHLTTRHWRTHSCGCQRRTSERSVVDSSGLNANEFFVWNNISTQRKRSAPTVGCFRLRACRSDSVGTFRGRYELCIVVKRNEAKFLFDITTDLPLCGGREEYLRSMRIFIRYSERSRPAKSKRRMV